MSSNIRFATSADLPTICRLIRALAEYERLADKVDFGEETMGQHQAGQPQWQTNGCV